jgi:hypothetical protein
MELTGLSDEALQEYIQRLEALLKQALDESRKRNQS